MFYTSPKQISGYAPRLAHCFFHLRRLCAASRLDFELKLKLKPKKALDENSYLTGDVRRPNHYTTELNQSVPLN